MTVPIPVGTETSVGPMPRSAVAVGTLRQAWRRDQPREGLMSLHSRTPVRRFESVVSGSGHQASPVLTGPAGSFDCGADLHHLIIQEKVPDSGATHATLLGGASDDAS